MWCHLNHKYPNFVIIFIRFLDPILFMNFSLIQEFFILNKMFNVLMHAMHILFDLIFSYLLSSVSGYDF